MRTLITYRNSVKIPSKLAYFVLSNHSWISKYFVIACKPSAVLALYGVLGALGRRFESYRPDSIKSKSY